MKLEDIDGDIYITESLMESLRDQKPVLNKLPKYTVVVDETPIGILKSFKIFSLFLELEFNCTIDLATLVKNVIGKYIKVSGMNLMFKFKVEEISCDIETSRCTVKAIHTEEVIDE